MTEQPNSNEIAIVDLGGQYCHMISRRLRDAGIWSTIVPANTKPDDLSAFSGIILSGGPQSVYAKNAPKVDEGLYGLGRPMLGICYGHQLIAKRIGAEVSAGAEEFGHSRLRLRESDTLFTDLPDQQDVWMSHSDSVTELPTGVLKLAETDRCEVAAFADMKSRLFGVQFHPEVSHTEFGQEILENFAVGVCKVTKDRSADDRVSHLIARIQQDVGDKSVFFLVSGGVDSTVAFALCARALPPERVLGVYVDTGLMRAQETEELKGLLDELGVGERLKVLDRREKFVSALAGKIEPEEKRAIIGRLFLEAQSEACVEYGIDPAEWLIGQGTIYPDTIESGGTDGTAALIKTHHNRCPEMRAMVEAGLVIEPLKDFYKDEVRQIGADLGLPDRLTQRWPFPGPGLGIRVLCTEKDAAGVAEPTALPPGSAYEAVSLPIRSVGVQGDARTYRRAVAIKGTIDYPALQALGTHLCNVGKVHNRVVLRLDPGEIDGARLLPDRTITEERLETLRRADFIVRETMARRGRAGAVWQFPVVLIPIAFGVGDAETIVLRPVNSQDGMTARCAELDPKLLAEISSEISEIPGVGAVFLDISDKPPATIEWE